MARGLAGSRPKCSIGEAIVEGRSGMPGRFQPYRGEKRRKEEARKTRKEQKLKRKQGRKGAGPPIEGIEPEEPESEPGSPPAENPTAGPPS